MRITMHLPHPARTALRIVPALAVASLVALAAAPARALTVGQPAPALKLDGDAGGLVSGGAWSSDQLTDGKVHMLLYVDPDEKDVNLDLETAVKEQGFPKDQYGSIAVINMDATWLPNAAIASKLEAKQKDYPDTTYVKDMKKALVAKWALKDDAYCVDIVDKKGVVSYEKCGALTKDEIAAVIAAIKSGLASAP
jgi:predicted transcriptional regulator